MAQTAFNLANFRAQFPAFTAIADATLQANWTTGTAYVNSYNANTCAYTQAQAQLANDLMAAHITALGIQIAANQAPGVMTAATEGSVNITLLPPPVKSAFGYWLSSTPYGAQLRALLDQIASVGFFVGGSLERSSYRGAGGRFGG